MSITTVIRVSARALRLEVTGAATPTAASLTVPETAKVVARTLEGIGFRTLRQPAPDRIVGEDAAGRALVAEVRPDGRIQAEVLGAADASCVRVMEAFLEGLRREGLDVAVEEQRWTGGVPQTNAGRAWVRQRYASGERASRPHQEKTRPIRRRTHSRIGG